MGNCLSDSAIRDEELNTAHSARAHASHMAVNPLGKIVQFGDCYTEFAENDPIAMAEQLQSVHFADNGIESANKVVNREKAAMISRNAKLKLQSQACEEIIEKALDFD